MFDNFIYQALGRRRALELQDDKYHDVLDLWRLRILDISARGRSVTEIRADIRNRFDRPLKVVIPAGTYFQSRGQHQHMVARTEHVFRVPGGGKRYITVPATCINAERPIPGNDDQFRGVKKVPPNVQRFLKETDKQSPMVVQAGVWSMTDGYSREQIKSRLHDQSVSGVSRQAISDSDISTAKMILDRLSIPNRLD